MTGMLSPSNFAPRAWSLHSNPGTWRGLPRLPTSPHAPSPRARPWPSRVDLGRQTTHCLRQVRNRRVLPLPGLRPTAQSPACLSKFRELVLVPVGSSPRTPLASTRRSCRCSPRISFGEIRISQNALDCQELAIGPAHHHCQPACSSDKTSKGSRKFAKVRPKSPITDTPPPDETSTADPTRDQDRFSRLTPVASQSQSFEPALRSRRFVIGDRATDG